MIRIIQNFGYELFLLEIRLYYEKKGEFQQLPFKFINGDDVRRSHDRVRGHGGDDVEKWKDQRL